MELTSSQHHVLCAICDAFLPAAPGWPSAVERGVPEALAAALDFNPRVIDRWEFLNLLDFWDSPLHSFFAVGSFTRFSQLPPEDQYRMLSSWADSRIPLRRAAFQALRKAIGFLYVMLPGASGKTNGVWEKMGYPGPIGVQRPEAPRKLQVMTPEQDTTLKCDVCVIGSGAGGGVAAAVLATAGKEVIVVEAGGYFDDADFDGAELKGFERLYAECGFAATCDHSVGMLAGECLGGGTVVNYTIRSTTEFRSASRSWSGGCGSWGGTLAECRATLLAATKDAYAGTAAMAARSERNNPQQRLGWWTRSSMGLNCW